MFGDVVHAEDAGAGMQVQDGEGQRGREAFGGVGIAVEAEAADEALAAEGAEDGVAQGEEVGGGAEQFEVLGDGLAEAQAGVEQDAVGGDAGGAGGRGPFGEEGADGRDHAGGILGRGLVAVGVAVGGGGGEAVHQDDGAGPIGGEGEHGVVLGAGGDIVDRVGAGIEGGAGDGGQGGIDGDRKVDAGGADGLDRRDQTADLFIGRDAGGAGAGGFGAEVEGVCSVVGGAAGGVGGMGGGGQSSAVGEGVGGDVEDGQQTRAVQVDRPRVVESPDVARAVHGRL